MESLEKQYNQSNFTGLRGFTHKAVCTINTINILKLGRLAQ